METIKTTRIIEEVTGYKAYDGRMFKEKEECEKYERTANAVIIQDFKNIVVKMLEGATMTNMGDCYPMAACDECWYYVLVRITNETDLKIAQMYQEISLPKAKRKFNTDDIGKELVVTIGERYGDHCYIWETIDECVDRYRKCLSKLTEDNTESAK